MQQCSHLVMVAPHEAGSTDQVIAQAHQLVDPCLGGHGSMIATVLYSQTDPSTSKACNQQTIHVNVHEGSQGAKTAACIRVA